MGFGEAVRTCFRKYFTLSGRASRSEYWWFVLAIFLLSILAAVIDGMVLGSDAENGPVGIVVSLVTFVPSITVLVRRLHDTNRPGYYFFAPILFMLVGSVVIWVLGIGVIGLVLGGIIIVLGILLQLWWLIQRSDEGDNTYGPNPHVQQSYGEVFR